jgi:hypothetical protein
VAAGRKSNKKSLCADLAETTDKDIGTNDSDRTVKREGGRAWREESVEQGRASAKDGAR